jgi:hypothetical protein
VRPLLRLLDPALRPVDDPRDEEPALRDEVPREEEPALRDEEPFEVLLAPRDEDEPRVEPALRDAEPRLELALRAELLRVPALRPEPERVFPPALRDELVVREPVLREPP